MKNEPGGIEKVRHAVRFLPLKNLPQPQTFFEENKHLK